MLGIDPEFPKTRDIHVHLPAGATPKDGPSAGIAIAAALVSALTGVAVRGDTAMTGEVTLRGRVLPIGGLKEKLVAARRAGITHIIIPEGNAREIEEIPVDIREGLIFHPVSTMDEVLSHALRAVGTCAPGSDRGNGHALKDAKKGPAKSRPTKTGKPKMPTVSRAAVE